MALGGIDVKVRVVRTGRKGAARDENDYDHLDTTKSVFQVRAVDNADRCEPTAFLLGAVSPRQPPGSAGCSSDVASF